MDEQPYPLQPTSYLQSAMKSNHALIYRVEMKFASNLVSTLISVSMTMLSSRRRWKISKTTGKPRNAPSAERRKAHIADRESPGRIYLLIPAVDLNTHTTARSVDIGRP